MLWADMSATESQALLERHGRRLRPPVAGSVCRANGSQMNSAMSAGIAHAAMAAVAPHRLASGAVKLDTRTATSVSANVVEPTAMPTRWGSRSAITPGTMVPTAAIPKPPMIEPMYSVTERGGTARIAHPTTTAAAPQTMIHSRLRR